jgi:hypothetical protein
MIHYINMHDDDTITGDDLATDTPRIVIDSKDRQSTIFICLLPEHEAQLREIFATPRLEPRPDAVLAPLDLAQFAKESLIAANRAAGIPPGGLPTVSPEDCPKEPMKMKTKTNPAAAGEEEAGAQVWIERVGEGLEASVIIEDGMVKGPVE